MGGSRQGPACRMNEYCAFVQYSLTKPRTDTRVNLIPSATLVKQFKNLKSTRNLRLYNVIDEFNHEVMSIEVGFSISSERVIRSCMQIISRHGKPQVIRFDKASENVSGTIQK